jgi:arsenite methyltransferase
MNEQTMIDECRDRYADGPSGGLSNQSNAVRDTDVFNFQTISKEKTMRSVQVYDKPMCCSTGVCGPDVDPVLPQFAADLDWLKTQGHSVERYNLAQQPQAFIENQSIHHLLSTAGTECLPVVIIDGDIVSQSVYPSREKFAGWVDG